MLQPIAGKNKGKRRRNGNGKNKNENQSWNITGLVIEKATKQKNEQ